MEEKNSSDAASYARCFSIIYRHGKLMNDRAVKAFHLSGGQMDYLRVITHNPGISQENLARYYKIDKGSIAKSTKRMIKLGYIRREQNPEDKRAYCLFPTEKSMQICKMGEAHAAEIEGLLTEGMTEEEIETFHKLLIKVTDNIAKIMEGGKDI